MSTCPNDAKHIVTVSESVAGPDKEFPGKPIKVVSCACGFSAEVYRDLVFSSHENRWRPR